MYATDLLVNVDRSLRSNSQSELKIELQIEPQKAELQSGPLTKIKQVCDGALSYEDMEINHVSIKHCI